MAAPITDTFNRSYTDRDKSSPLSDADQKKSCDISRILRSPGYAAVLCGGAYLSVNVFYRTVDQEHICQHEYRMRSDAPYFNRRSKVDKN